jgi:AcrR family transcriptional regulator
MAADSEPASLRRSRGSLSKELILDAAYGTVKDEGLQGLSMPQLARKLGASPMSIYRYFRNKDELLDELTAMALDEQCSHREAPSADASWDHRIRVEMRAGRRFILEHPGLGELLLFRDRPHLAPDTMARLERRVATLVEAGFMPHDAARVWISARTYTWGFAVWETARSHEHTAEWGRHLAALPAEAFPTLVAAAGALSDTVGDTQFEFGLDLLLDAAESIRARKAE